MKVYNQEKTRVLNEYDLSVGKLVDDKIFIAHHDAIQEKTAEQVAEERRAEGKQVETINEKFYVVTAAYDSGRIVESIEPVPAQEAWDEYEDIQVYVPYTAEELTAHKMDALRKQRAAECFPIVNRGALWYEKLTDAQRQELSKWYEAWLDAPETGTAPEKPAWLENVAKQEK